MESGNILSDGIDALNTIKEHLLELNGYKEKTEQLTSDEKKFEKAIEIKERDIQDEISVTLKKRREEIEQTFDEQIDKLKAKMKKFHAKKDKLKDAKISERIKFETSDLIEENKKLSINVKNIFKQNHVPKIYNNSLYYSLFFPSSLMDWVLILLIVALAFLAIPCGIYFGLLPERKIIYLVAIYFITIIVICGLYILINNISKSKYIDVIVQVKQLRIQIKVNKKKMIAIKKSIKNDKDESRYGLDKINQEMQELETNIEESKMQKEEAITNFNNTTKLVITTEIKAKHQEEFDKLKMDYENTHNEINRYDTKIKEMTLVMANNYEAYIGKDFLKIEKIDALINLMETRGITTISEGLATINQESEHLKI